MTRIGPAGWSYKDWQGVVYPSPQPRNFQPVAFLAEFFDTLEINVSFYRPLSAKTVESWLKQVAGHPRFRFTAKLWRGFTHERTANAGDMAKVREGLDVLAEEDCLGALLIQFPWSFRYTTENICYVRTLLEGFCSFPLVLEVRHASWNDPMVYEYLEEQSVGMCNIDQPLFRHSIHPDSVATAPTGYVRLHGRNYERWFTANRYQGERYDYLYKLEELEPWLERIKTVASRTRDTYVITNNHYLGKAVVNALEIASLLKGKSVKAPAELLRTYPELQAFTETEHRPEQLNLL